MRDSPLPSIERVYPEEEPIVLPQLIHLLQDTVASGTSVGFLPPLSTEDAQQYWSTVFEEVAQGTRVLLVVREAGQVVGSVQLALVTKPNARHRAEVQKLFVLSSQHRRGIGQALMQAVEQAARDGGERCSCSIPVREIAPSNSIARWGTARWASFLGIGRSRK